ncbi:uncharacterized protein K460DRAFT_19513 [Cucurbitaria berberidis CBS 394.84]|uniref:Uncharacterized protein n=1 Tax=Cucurbitaria berberidis CBS 394.84 TaxID=1168544 RepID=A0A9P4GRZ3_9PLEO|nr:uncharacterized protein K460DRAFT_19513 [Cucurbitaria berberidis CBS 394.84]KAF1850665.1 hypothetical protein K460DRAFT_19513 [Cucurbitaria berberidis CBS 394.84]
MSSNHTYERPGLNNITNVGSWEPQPRLMSPFEPSKVKRMNPNTRTLFSPPEAFGMHHLANEYSSKAPSQSPNLTNWTSPIADPGQYKNNMDWWHPTDAGWPQPGQPQTPNSFNFGVNQANNFHNRQPQPFSYTAPGSLPTPPPTQQLPYDAQARRLQQMPAANFAALSTGHQLPHSALPQAFPYMASGNFLALPPAQQLPYDAQVRQLQQMPLAKFGLPSPGNRFPQAGEMVRTTTYSNRVPQARQNSRMTEYNTQQPASITSQRNQLLHLSSLVPSSDTQQKQINPHSLASNVSPKSQIPTPPRQAQGLPSQNTQGSKRPASTAPDSAGQAKKRQATAASSAPAAPLDSRQYQRPVLPSALNITSNATTRTVSTTSSSTAVKNTLLNTSMSESDAFSSTTSKTTSKTASKTASKPASKTTSNTASNSRKYAASPFTNPQAQLDQKDQNYENQLREQHQIADAERLDRERRLSRKKELLTDESSLYRHYNEYLQHFPLQTSERRNQYLSRLLANQYIPMQTDSDLGRAIACAKEHWDIYMEYPKDINRALEYAKAKTERQSKEENGKGGANREKAQR